ncbi:hypothetical protein [Actinokineospora cianjurensis]|uniref:Tissue inhibitor of metalloproteinase n=1 Tax=Actinokineospora cianjurensis TaxID=585224 RepID=A0A421B192_9PSEU|nr:hypothetical protein [Actinokineospora cianjurensis]RLK58046.1 hypothetical protein CLV68_4138 [Actinokineospora cianjurensis]
MAVFRSRFARVLAVIGLAAAMLVGVFVGTASACSCLPGGEGAKYARATHVFTGVVVGRALLSGDPDTAHDDKYRYLVLNYRNHKGSAPALVGVETAVGGATCGIELALWSSYVVFAQGDASDGVVETTLCSGTRLASGGPPVTEEPPTTTTPRPTALGGSSPACPPIA